jgi:hypothetical protein
MDLFRSNIVIGIGAAIGATLLAPVLIPVLSSVGRPLAKTVIRSGLMLYEKTREAVAGAGEMLEDLVAEVRVEEAQRPLAAGAAAAGMHSQQGNAGEVGATQGGNGSASPAPLARTEDGGLMQ